MFSDIAPDVYTSAKEQPTSGYWVSSLAIAAVIVPMVILQVSIVITLIVAMVAFLVTEWLVSRLREPAHPIEPVPVPLPAELPPAPPPDQLIKMWREILSGRTSNGWVIFGFGTLVVIANASQDPQAEAIAILKEHGKFTVGTSSADMYVYRLPEAKGFVIGCHHPQIFTHVDAIFGITDKAATALPGSIGRMNRHCDAHLLNVIHVEQSSIGV